VVRNMRCYLIEGSTPFYSYQICGRSVKRNAPGIQLGEGGAVPSFRSTDDEIKDNSAPNKEVASSNAYIWENK